MSAPGLIIAAPSSGSGKTVLTLGMIRHWTRTGRTVVSAKVGPDYIDPAFHAAASGRSCINLDPWAMPVGRLAGAAARIAAGADIVVCEGVMGLFDGATATRGSTADVAAALGWPVILVLDVQAQAASVAAVVRGFATHRAEVRIAGVVFNRVGSRRHAEVLSEACAHFVPDIAVLGAVPRADGLRLPERHLGLVQAREHPDLAVFLDRAADLIAEHVDVRRLRGLARPAATETGSLPSTPPIPPPGQRIAVADDDAFAFRYALVIDGWRAAGSEIIPFSPLADHAPTADADAIYLPGGYPELYAGRLAANGTFLGGLRLAAARGAVVFGECGGYMTMGDGLIDAEGAHHTMAGLLRLQTSFADRRLHLGYRMATVLADGPLGPAGARIFGHEFHYARTLCEGPGVPLFDCDDATGRSLGTTGLAQGRICGSFIHLINRADDIDAPADLRNDCAP
ncbi:MAG: cobyrinate a,c-diamide synthase [Rhodospirillales bacterium]|nr:cobyrinate a,c-diamide synthase [Rhodospirillales bacterium]